MVSLVLYVSGGIYYRVFLQLVVRASRGRVYCNEEERREESRSITSIHRECCIMQGEKLENNKPSYSSLWVYYISNLCKYVL